MANEENPTPEAATPEQAPANQNGTVNEENAGEAEAQNKEKTASSSESFTSVDPNSLTPELRASYDNMLRDYKSKTAKVAEQRRDIAADQEKIQRHDEITSDPAFVEYYNNYGQSTPQSTNGQPQPQQSPEVGTEKAEEEFQQAFNSRASFDAYVEQKISEKSADTKKEVAMTKAFMKQQKANDFISKFKSQEGNSDFERLNKHGLVSGYLQLNPARTEADWGKALTKARDYARMVLGEERTAGKEEGLGRATEKVNNSTEEPTPSPGQVYSHGDPKNLSVSEAIELAQRGIKVPQKWK